MPEIEEVAGGVTETVLYVLGDTRLFISVLLLIALALTGVLALAAVVIVYPQQRQAPDLVPVMLW
jgi:hypothetical protein